MKVEAELTDRKFTCSLSNFMTRNMNDLKNHLMSVHKKEQYDWMVEEIKAEYVCDECDLKFPRMSLLTSHLDIVHGGDRVTIKTNHEEDSHSIDEITLNVISFPCDCTICGELLMDNFHSQKHMKEHFEKVKIKKEDVKVPFKLKVDENETDSCSSDEEETPPPNFLENGTNWNKL